MITRCILLAMISVLSISCSDSSEDCDNGGSLLQMQSSMSIAPYPIQQQAKLQLEVEKFASCQEIEDELLPNLEKLAQAYDYDGINVPGSGGNICSVFQNHSGGENLDSQPQPTEGGVTNLQEAGVDEGDMVKVSPALIFVAKPGHIEILNRGDLSPNGKIDTLDLKNTSLMAFDKTLVVMGITQNNGDATTKLSFYGISGAEVPVLKNDFLVRGKILNTRLLNGRLIVVTNKNLVTSIYGQSKDQLQSSLRGNLDGIDCTSIYKPLTNEADSQLSTVHQFDLNGASVAYSRRSILGSFSELYMNDSHLYLTKKNIYIEQGQPEPNETASTPIVGPNPIYVQSYLVNAVTKWNFTSSAPQLEAVGAFEGRTIGAWAYKELAEGELSVATTTNHSSHGQTNHLFVLSNKSTESDSEHMSIVGRATDFGRTENIRSVRYIENKAYVVTFKKTDPLFIIDLVNPTDPQILSELKAPGFSRYMHPALGDKLIGLGYAADDQGNFAYFQGVQLSLFDIANPLEPGIVSQIEIGDRGSFSDVLFNHQAFYHDPSSNLLGFPIVRVQALSSDPWAYKTHEFTGAQFYRVSESGFESLGQATHAAMINSQCQFQEPSSFWWNTPVTSLDINRIFKVDDKLLAVSRFGLTHHDSNQPGTVLKSVQFENSPMDCELE